MQFAKLIAAQPEKRGSGSRVLVHRSIHTIREATLAYADIKVLSHRRRPVPMAQMGPGFSPGRRGGRCHLESI